MFKTLSRSLLLLCCFALFAAAADAGEKKITLKVNATTNPKAFGDMPAVYLMQEFKKRMEERFPGRVEVRLYWDEQLSKTYDGSLNSLQNGVFHLSTFPISSMSEYTKAGIPFTNLFLVPYPHHQIIYDAFDGEIGKMITERIVKEARVRPIMFWEVGFRHLLNSRNPVTDIADIRGMKFRVQPNPVHLESFRLLGTNPTPIPWAELFTALQQGVVDGTENPIENVRSGRLYEVQKYMTMTGHAFEMTAICMGEEFYQNKLPADIRDGMHEIVAELTKKHREGIRVVEVAMLKMFQERSMKINELSPENLARFREAVHPAREISRKQAGDEYTDKFFELMDKYEKEYFERIGK